jgi:hypothetical protein
MRVQGFGVTTLNQRAEKIRQIERIASSSILQGSESLCKLLQYLAERELAEPGSIVTEHEIATGVFARPANFDARFDSTVKVQTARLRSKLAEYYAHDGIADSLIVEIPTDAYTVLFRYRAPLEGRSPGATLMGSEMPVFANVRKNYRAYWVTFLVVAIALALISAAALGYFLIFEGDTIWTRFAAEYESPVL